MKTLYLFLIIICFSQNSQAQSNNVPSGKRTFIVDSYNYLTIVTTTKLVTLIGPTFFNRLNVYEAPDYADIIDARFKIRVGGQFSDERILILLSDGSTVQLRYQFGAWATLHYDPIPNDVSFNEYYKILGDDLYVMTYNGVYVSDSGYNWAIDTIGLNNPMYYDIDIDTMQRVWLCTSNGLFTQELNVTTWVKNNNYNGVGCDHVFIDRRQNVWVSYFNMLYVSYNRGLSFQEAPSGLSSAMIEAISDDAFGNIYAMSKNNLFYSQGGTQPFVQISQPVMTDFNLFVSKNVFNDITGDTLIYLCTDAGLYTSANQGVSWIYDQTLRADHFNSIAATVDDRLLMTTNTGLYRLEHDDTTWTKRYPQNGFLNDTKAFRATNGDVYLLAEQIGTNSSGSYSHMVYKSTDNANTFSPDTTGIKSGDVAMTLFFVDENGVQHANADVNQGGYSNRVWKKEPGQPWTVDTVGLPNAIGADIHPACFGTDLNGKIYIALLKSGVGYTTIYSRPIGGSAWASETGLSGFVFNIKGRNGIATAGTEAGMVYNNGSGWKTAPLPVGVSPVVGWCVSEVDNNNNAWAYFDTYDVNNNGNIGEGIYYTSDFTNWKEPKNNIDTILFSELVAIGDSVYAITLGSDGIYIFDTTTTTGTGVNNPLSSQMNIVVLPNPFQDETVIQFELPEQSNVRLTICSLLGEIVYEVNEQRMDRGEHQLKINLPGHSNGVYLYDLNVNGISTRGKIMRN